MTLDYLAQAKARQYNEVALMSNRWSRQIVDGRREKSKDSPIYRLPSTLFLGSIVDVGSALDAWFELPLGCESR